MGRDPKVGRRFNLGIPKILNNVCESQRAGQEIEYAKNNQKDTKKRAIL